jgi:metallophosphoesterase superfamily enzyme
VKVLAGFELHVPFQHPDSLAFLETVAETYKIDRNVSVGDLVDAHMNSRYDHDPDGWNAGEEVDRAQDALAELFTLFPEGDICTGNHDLRIAKAAFKAGIPKSAIRSFEEIYDIPEGWTSHEHAEIDGVVYEHGDRFGSGAYSHVKAAKSNMKSTVIGHTHVTFGVEYIANRDKLIFAANSGCLVDTHSYSMAYGKAYAGKPILGALVIVDGAICIPVPMILDHKHRWIRRI